MASFMGGGGGGGGGRGIINISPSPLVVVGGEGCIIKINLKEWGGGVA